MKIKNEINKIGSIEIYKLVQKYGTPLYVYDSKNISLNYKKIYNSFLSKYNKLQLCYSVKVNNNLAILKYIHNLGAGFDCSSKGEIYLAKKTGKAFISYVGNYNSNEELKYALDKTVDNFILDDISILDRLKNFDINKKTSFGFRINADLDIKDDSGIQLSGPNSKFGISEKHIIAAYKKLKNLGVQKFSIHMMIGSNIVNPFYFKAVAEKLMTIIKIIKENLNIEIDFIDIGGGFGIAYNDKSKDLNIERTAKEVTDTIKKYVKKYNLKEPILIIEPGRYILGHSGYLLGKIHSIKKEVKKYVGTDISINSILRIPLFKAQHEVSVHRLNNLQNKTERVNLCGQICWDGDILRKDIKLPILNIGDIIVLHDVGAYGFCHSNQFNTRTRPTEILISNGKSYLIRERERLTEFDRLVKIPDFLNQEYRGFEE